MPHIIGGHDSTDFVMIDPNNGILRCFTYLRFPKDLWSKIRTTNILEREFREVRRRMKVFDNTFQNEESANRYANTIFTNLNNNYPLKSTLHTKI